MSPEEKEKLNKFEEKLDKLLEDVQQIKTSQALHAQALENHIKTDELIMENQRLVNERLEALFEGHKSFHLKELEPAIEKNTGFRKWATFGLSVIYASLVGAFFRFFIFRN